MVIDVVLDPINKKFTELDVSRGGGCRGMGGDPDDTGFRILGVGRVIDKFLHSLVPPSSSMTCRSGTKVLDEASQGIFGPIR